MDDTYMCLLRMFIFLFKIFIFIFLYIFSYFDVVVLRVFAAVRSRGIQIVRGEFQSAVYK